jgi:hypothetical protein
MDNKINDGGPAFPIKDWPSEIDKKGYVKKTRSYRGMTLRDYFAAKASSFEVGEIMSRQEHRRPVGDMGSECTISYQEARYIHADEMLKAREK